jgi:uncharacterized protein YktB (UPF0637 family)
LPFPYNNPMFGQSNVYQQMLQQYQQNMMQPQQGVTIFTNVPSEEVARRSDVPPNTTRNFINENEGYVYLKSVGMSILEPYVFKTFKLVEVTDEPQTKTATNETESPQVDMNSYMKKEDFEPYKEIINDMKTVVEELKS